MDTLKRVQMLRTSVARTMDRLEAMEIALDKADQEIAITDSQMRFVSSIIRRLKKDGLTVSMDEYFKVKVELLHLQDRLSRINFEVSKVKIAYAQAERVLEYEQEELSALEPRVGVLLQFRRN